MMERAKVLPEQSMKPIRSAFQEQLRQVAERHYPDTRFEILPLPSRPRPPSLGAGTHEQWFSFRGYCRLASTVLSPATYRRSDRDFELFLSSGEHTCVALSGWWRSLHIAYLWAAEETMWVTDDGQIVSRPFPDGLEFEQMAHSFLRLLLEQLIS
jgi:hypothetical protein